MALTRFRNAFPTPIVEIVGASLKLRSEVSRRMCSAGVLSSAYYLRSHGGSALLMTARSEIAMQQSAESAGYASA
jgi:hypothetical protein